MANRVETRDKPKEVPVARTTALAPFGDFPFMLSRMRDEFDRMFERLSREWPMFRGEGTGWRWGLEIKEEDDAIMVRAEAPGFEPGEFDVQVSDGRLILRAARKTESKDEKGQVRESTERECYESVTLPSAIDREKVEAKYHNGILTVTLPRTATAKAKRITVQKV